MPIPRSIGPRRDKWIVLNILATPSISPDETDRADVARRWHGSIEMTSAIGVAMQTGTASACGVCVMPYEQGRIAARIDLRRRLSKAHVYLVPPNYLERLELGTGSSINESRTPQLRIAWSGPSEV